MKKNILMGAVIVIIALAALGAIVGYQGPAAPTAYAAQLSASMSDTNDPATCSLASSDRGVATYTCAWTTGSGVYGPGNTTDFQTATVLLYADGSFQISPGGSRSAADAIFTP